MPTATSRKHPVIRTKPPAKRGIKEDARVVFRRNAEDDARAALRGALDIQEAKFLYSRNQAARLLSLSLSSYKLLVARGELREVRAGKRRLVSRAEIDRFIGANMTPKAC